MKKTILLVLLFVLIACGPVEPPSVCLFPAESFVEHLSKAPSADEISIASFNIQVFGTTKAAKPKVVDILSDIGNDFDILAVQELRDSKGEVIPFYLEKLNAESQRYEVLSSERLGRSTSKEQYAFYYDTNKFEVLGEPYTFEDIDDAFEREPFLVHFKSKQGSFDFVLVNIHTKPNDAAAEIDALASVVEDAKQHFNEQDVIVLGDFNADGSYFQEENDDTALEDEAYSWLVCDDVDTTVAKGDNTYDRIVVTQGLMEDFTGEVGVRYYDEEFDLTPEQTKDISDHFPVYALFHISKDTD